MKRLVLLLTVLAALVAGASAQVKVNIEVKRHTYIRYEPLLVTVSITNLSGRDLVLNQYYTSPTASIDISEGRTVWKQSVGVPDTFSNAGQTRDVALLAASGIQHQYLYCRVIDPLTGNVLCMQRLGHMVDGSQFDAQFDAVNTLNVLQLAGPKTYTLTQIGVNGDIYGQWVYDAPKVKPYLRRDGAGNLDVVGATRRVQVAKDAPPAPKLSDRPAGLPKPGPRGGS
jgi:hypothetical protein